LEFSFGKNLEGDEQDADDRGGGDEGVEHRSLPW
jgi:hypothetical protein